MVLPIIAGIFAIIRIAAAALAIYETYEVLHDIYEGLDNFKRGMDRAKREIEETIEKLKAEIDENIDEKSQVAMLMAASTHDRTEQSEATRRGTGRGADNGVISAAIKQDIPFRKVISDVCEKADRMPVLQLRKKHGVSVRDLPHAKRKALEEIIKKSLDEIADIDLEQFIVCRLKQLSASLMFEFIDYCIDWKSPMKAEVTFGPAPRFTDHPVEEGTKLKRVGKHSPFYPFPPPNNRRGSFSADLVINEYRGKPTGKSNLFAIVEIKFPGDKIEAKQFRQYGELIKSAAKSKTAVTTTRYENQPVSSGGRLSLFRFPEDKATATEDKNGRNNRGRRR